MKVVMLLGLGAAGCVASEPLLLDEVEQGVYGGTREADTSAPWVVSLSGCHGALISPRWALTAKHCVGTQPSATVSFTRTVNGVPATGSQVASVHVHATSDLALLHLPAPFSNPNVYPVELPRNRGFVGLEGLVASRGGNPSPAAGQVAVYRAPVILVGPSVDVVKTSTAALCPGDSGSGYVAAAGNRRFLIGIASSSAGGGTCNAGNHEAELVDVYQHLSWIYATAPDIVPPPAPHDTADLVWRNASTGAIAVWYGGISLTSGYPGNPGTGWDLRGAGDFDADGHSDLLWRASDGQSAIWPRALATGHIYPGNPGTTWDIQAAGDFVADSSSDIVWRAASGALSIWNNANPATAWTPASPGGGWQIRGSGDFNGDGASDLVWRATDGATAVWTGANPAAAWYPGNATTAYDIKAIGDFDGNGLSDLVFRHTNGVVKVWYDGLSTQTSTWSNPGLDWQIAGAGDFDADGDDDLVWRNTDGSSAIWLSANPSLAIYPGNPGSSWHIRAVGKFD